MILTRTHPLNPSAEITICTPSLSTPSVTSPLLATLFPSLAELLALDQASNIAVTHSLTRRDSSRLQTEALSRASACEAASLLWDSDSARYYLAHPSLNDPANSSTTPTTLHIEIKPGTSIRILDSVSQPLLALDLSTHGLKIHTNTILALSSSLYTLDTLMSALLTLLLHLHRHTALLAPHVVPLPHFPPPPTLVKAHARSKSSSLVPKPKAKSKPSRWLSLRRAQPSTNMPPSPSPTMRSTLTPSPNPTLTTLAHPSRTADKDIEATAGLPPTMSTPIPPSGVAPELRGSHTGLDLSRFQAFDLEDPELSHGTKATLRVIYWAFGVLVWILGVGVGCLAAAVVAIGSFFGGRGLGERCNCRW